MTPGELLGTDREPGPAIGSMLAPSMLKFPPLVLAAGLCLAVPATSPAAVDRPLVDSSDSRGAVRLVSAGRAATIALDADADPGVRRLRKVCERPARAHHTRYVLRVWMRNGIS